MNLLPPLLFNNIPDKPQQGSTLLSSTEENGNSL